MLAAISAPIPVMFALSLKASCKFTCWAELRGGGKGEKHTEKQNIARIRGFAGVTSLDTENKGLKISGKFRSIFGESLNGGSQMALHSLQFAHDRLQLWTFVALNFVPLSKGNFRRKMTTIAGNRGQLWTSTLRPHLLSPSLRISDHLSARKFVTHKHIFCANFVLQTCHPKRDHFLNLFRGFARQGGFQKGGFGRCSAVPKFPPQKVLPCSSTLAEESYDFESSWIPTAGTRTHSPRPPFYKTALWFPLEEWPLRSHFLERHVREMLGISKGEDKRRNLERP